MADVSPIIPFNDTPKLDEYRLSSGYPGIALLEKSAQAFDKAASVCMVRRHALLLATMLVIYVGDTVLKVKSWRLRTSMSKTY